MKYAGIIKNDIAAAPGLCVTFFTQGCPHRCPECQNPETWDFDGGLEYTEETVQEILKALTDRGLHRDLCIMGGEPLCPQNQKMIKNLVFRVKNLNPSIKIYIWTGYYIEDLAQELTPELLFIYKNIDCIIDGPYDKDKKDTTLEMRGSSNQRIFYLRNGQFIFDK